MKKLICIALILCAPWTHAYELGQVSIAETVNLNSSLVKLKLQGASLQRKLVFDVYIGAFYAQANIHSPSQALADKGPKRMWIYMLYNGVSAQQFRNGWQDIIEENNDSELLVLYEQELNTFLNCFTETLHTGDILTIDYLPGKGTQVMLNHKIKATIKNPAFFAIIFKTWMGQQPVNQKFQQELFKLTVAQ